MFFYRDTPPGVTIKTDPHWLSKYPEGELATSYNQWVTRVPRNPITGLPTIIGWHEDYPTGSLNHLSNYEEKMIRLLTGTCTRNEAYELPHHLGLTSKGR
jgi:hypothetical protein